MRPGAGYGAAGVGFARAPGARGAWNPAWGRTGYWGARSWSTGWYRVNPVGWGWWRPSSAAWGLTGLATAATINALVNQSVAQQSTVIAVPQSFYQLDYSSLQATAPYGANFTYISSGEPLAAQVDCQQGLFSDQPPQSANEAQLLNAACQVAYGNGS
ncbi:hypothetical protein [Cyanobium sp. ATX 6F1]|uniref:hypothetical protein n=1 Tax=unclassified Cyanobium TaxID=2627006 RepID=UPI0020CF7C62|nr:hypothetical protein [Cyanobium sp. ATX 6F1]MCP9915639.1 hypothetical protein [Cyanobium sp. ATX 6F1]